MPQARHAAINWREECHGSEFDLVIRGGLVVDGSGAAPREADIAIKGGRIADIGKIIGSGIEEIDAKAKIVTQVSSIFTPTMMDR